MLAVRNSSRREAFGKDHIVPEAQELFPGYTVEKLDEADTMCFAYRITGPCNSDKAMRIILLERYSYTATSQELNLVIEHRGPYKPKDGNLARARQINVSIKKCPVLFDLAGPGVVRLVNDSQELLD
jgi:hypothetical protein